MSEYVFLFDLDATITRAEILPEIAVKIDKQQQMRELTEKTMTGEIPFDHSFLERVKLLSEIPVSTVRRIIAGVPLNEKLVEFIRENRERCYVVTGNLDVWIKELMTELGMDGHYFCSKAAVENDKIVSVDYVVDKAEVVREFGNKPFVAVGDGNNDAQKEQQKQASMGDVKDIRKVLNNNTIAEFGYNEPTNRITIKIKDKDTNEVIKEIPSEKALEMLAKAWELAGIMVDERR